MRRLPLLLLALGCAAAPRAGEPTPLLLLAHDDGRVDGAITFPTGQHEGVIRFELPPGSRAPRRLWIQATGPGALRLTFYDQTPLEGPGEVLYQSTLVVRPEHVSSGTDGRWIVQDLEGAPRHRGVLWLGLRREDGEPQVAASRADAGQYFVRTHEPERVSMLPVRRTPLVRLELWP